MIFTRIATLFITLALLSSCQGTTNDNLFSKQNIGALTGAVGGAWVGSNVGKGKGNIAAIAVGTLLGAKLGQSIGSSLDKADLDYYNRTSQSSLETSQNGVVSTWKNPDTGRSGTITPIKTFQQANGTHCREYSQTIFIDGREQEAYGTACRQPNGYWEISQ